MKKYLITGGAGFIGSMLVYQLLQPKDCNVLVIDNLCYSGSLKNLAHSLDNPHLKFQRIDIRESDAIESAIFGFKPDRIIHLAAETHVDRSIASPKRFVETNINGTFHLLMAALHYWESLTDSAKATFHFLHISTDEVYGSQLRGRFTEDSAYQPNSPYSASKAASDHLVRAWHKTYGLPASISHCTNNYGPYQHPEKLIPRTIINALSRHPISVYGAGDNIRDWIFVEDHARALISVADRGKPGGTHLIGASNEYSNLDVVKKICQLIRKIIDPTFDYEALINFVPDRPGHDFRYALDPTQFEVEFGWNPIKSFDSTLAYTVKWYIEHRCWWQQHTAAGLKS